MYQTTARQTTTSHDKPHQVTAIHKLAVDAGNRFVKVATSTGDHEIFPSYLAKADFRDSNAIVYESGVRKDLIAQRWHIGESAKFKNGRAVFYSEKSDLMLQIVLGAMAQVGGSTTNISALNLCLPDGFN